MLKRKASISFIIAMAVAVMAMMQVTTSCSSDDDLLSLIPADADMVATLNLDKAQTDLDFEITPDGIKWPDDVDSKYTEAFGGDSSNQPYSLCRALQTDRIVMFAEASASVNAMTPCIVAGISSQEMLARVVGVPHATIDGYKVYDKNDLSVIAREDILWVICHKMTDADAVKYVKEISAAAKKKSIADDDVSAQTLRSDRIISVVGRMNGFIDMMSTNLYRYLDTQQALMVSAMLPLLRDKLLVGGLSVKDKKSLLAEVSMVDAKDGKTIEIPALTDLDSKVLAMLPKSTNALTALAVSNDAVKNFIESAGAFTQGNMILSTLLAELKNIDGTQAIGISQEKGYTLVLSMKPGTAEGSMNRLLGLIGNSGMATVTNTADSATVADQNGNRCMVRCNGDAIVMTTENDFTPGISPYLTRNLDGVSMVSEMYSAPVSKIWPGAGDADMLMRIALHNSTLEGSLTFENLKGSLAAQLFRINDALSRQ